MAGPRDLIRDRTRTPFNIGKRIDLDEFTFSEALPLARGLSNDPEIAKEVLQIIFEWTSGHPYLTQRACQEIAGREYPLNREAIKNVIKEIFFASRSEIDNNLQFVRDMLLERSPNKNQILTLYRKIRKGGKVLNEEKSPEKAYLKLSGVIKVHDNKLILRNRIYKEIFNLKWIRENVNFEAYPITSRRAFWVSGLSSFGVIFVLRTLGFWQSGELLTYDLYHRFTPRLPPDQRITFVEVSEEDLQKYGWPLSDQILATALEELQTHNPRVIGLDMFRNVSISPGKEMLKEALDADNLIVSTYGRAGYRNDGIAPPPEVPWERVGFNDLLIDPDGVTRRSLLFVGSRTNKKYSSLGLRVAMAYLGIDDDLLKEASDRLAFNSISIQILESGSGGYQKIDTSGYQILLRYRNATQITRRLTISQVLSGDFSPELIQDKILLIGGTARSLQDIFDTPYLSNSDNSRVTMAGTAIHVNIVSQLLGILEGEDAEFRFLSTWLEPFVIAIFALLGAFIPQKIRHPMYLAISVVLIIALIYGVPLILLINSKIWVPVIEPFSAFIWSIVFSGSTFYYYSFAREKY